MVKNKKAFTLVELLAVIVILAVILVIAVPSIMSTITESRKGALASSAKLIASSAETAYISNQTLGIEKDIECKDISNYTDEDYASCKIKFVDGKAKVKLIGQGKFEGMAVCGGTKEEAEVVAECPGPVRFADDDWDIIAEAVKDGNTSKYKVGDTRPVDLVINNEKKTYTLRIANNSHYVDKGECKDTTALASQTACGFVIEFADIISEQSMNGDDTNAGGWKDSAMRTYVNGTIYDALVAAIGDTNKTMIIDTTVVSGHESGKTTNYTTTDKVYLLSTREVWGSRLSVDTAVGDTITRQLDYYATYDNKDGTIGVTTSKYAGAIKNYNSNSASYWWLRSAISNSNNLFYFVTNSGDWGSYNASDTFGVSPAFRLG